MMVHNIGHSTGGDSNVDISRFFYQCHRPDFSLVVLKCDFNMNFFGVFDVQVLHGRVISRGYNFKAGAYAVERFIEIVAPYSIGPPASFVAVRDEAMTSLKFHRLKWRLNELTNEVDLILRELNLGDGILLLRHTISKTCTCFRELYGQVFFLPAESKRYHKVGLLCGVPLDKYPPLYENRTAANVIQLIEQIAAKSRQGKKSVTMVVGGKSTGKSMVSRVLANSFVEKNKPPVYILDCDVGQPEMNPPGCVSLLKLDSPLLGAPMFTQRVCLKDTYFIGRIFISTDCRDLFLNILRKLFQRFETDSAPSSPLIINTCGWVEGEGSSLLDDMVELFNPDFMFSFVSPTGPNYTMNSSLEEKHADMIVFCGDPVLKPTKVLSTASVLRNLRILGYLSNVCPNSTIKSFINTKPYAVPFSEIAVKMYIDDPFPADHLFSILNCTLVALCTRNCAVDSGNAKRLFNDRNMPILLDAADEEPLCVTGFGFIRATDLEKHLFYVLTPLELPVLQKINTFAYAVNITISQHIFASQSTKAVPYIVRSKFSSFHSELFKQLRIKSSYQRKKLLKNQISTKAFPVFSQAVNEHSASALWKINKLR